MFREAQLGHCFGAQNLQRVALNTVVAIGACLMLGACGSPKQVDYALEPRNASSKNPAEPLGSIKLHVSDEDKPYSVKLGRGQEGYQLYTAGPAFKNEKEKTQLDSLWVLSRDTAEEWFMGIRGSYTF